VYLCPNSVTTLHDFSSPFLSSTYKHKIENRRHRPRKLGSCLIKQDPLLIQANLPPA
jgi:hypothetical protein